MPLETPVIEGLLGVSWERVWVDALILRILEANLGDTGMVVTKYHTPSQEVILELTDDLVPHTDESPYEEVEFTHLGHKSYADQPVQFHCLSRVQTKPTHSVARDRSDASFTPPSSLDLEWEHEGGLLQFAPVPEEDPDKISSSDSHCPINSDDWSRISSPDSLEWDPVEAPLTSTASRSTGLDPATEMLLKRIEHLESSTLRETGDWKR